MNRSENINELAAALAKAQGEIKNAPKDSENPFFRSRYSDLASIMDVIRIPLSKNGLAIVQGTVQAVPIAIEEGIPIHDSLIHVETLLMHNSGQWISSVLSLRPVKNDPQGWGSVYTYARRYGLQAILGVASEDDDGNAAANVGQEHYKAEKAALKQPRPLQTAKEIHDTILPNPVEKIMLDDDPLLVTLPEHKNKLFAKLSRLRSKEVGNPWKKQMTQAIIAATTENTLLDIETEIADKSGPMIPIKEEFNRGPEFNHRDD